MDVEGEAVPESRGCHCKGSVPLSFHAVFMLFSHKGVLCCPCACRRQATEVAATLEENPDTKRPSLAPQEAKRIITIQFIHCFVFQ